ncbi:sarcosine oxidase subunit alpha family protein, partial [Mesorhizobium sp. M7A.F.Ca.CA.002.04.1.1]
IMSADAAFAYLRRHAVLVGRRIIVATNNDSAYEVAGALAEVGAEVRLVDIRRDGAPAAAANVRLIKGRSLASASGKLRVDGVTLDDGTRFDADCVVVSGGWTPTIHLFGQAKGKLAWSDARAAFLPGEPVGGIAVVGAAAGAVSLSEVFAGVEKAFAGKENAATPRSTGPEATDGILPAWPMPGSKGRIWIDYQNDVTVKDVELAARENFVSVEHLKRYTTLGMATDQGKTSNLPGLALMAGITGRTVPEVGTTTYRP